MQKKSWSLVRVLLILVLGLTMLLAAACNVTIPPLSEAASSPTDVPATNTPEPQPTASPTATKLPATKAPTLTPTVEKVTGFTQQTVTEVEQFLKGEGNYSLEILSETLFAPRGNDGKYNGMGVIVAFDHVVQVQNVLIDGAVIGDNAFFIFGTEDVNKHRFAYLAVFPVNDFSLVAFIDVHVPFSTYDSTWSRGRDILSSKEKVQEFIDNHKGMAVVSTLYISEGIPMDDQPPSVQAFAELGYSTIPRTNQLVNRMNRISRSGNVLNLSPSGGLGGNEGIFTLDNPVDPEALNNLGFDPNGMVMIWGVTTKE